LDFDEKKIGLSIRRLTPDPWLKFIEEFEIGAEVNGKIVKITDYGALIELKKGLTALLHASKLEESGDLAKFKENEEIKVKIIAIDAKNHRISLGARDIVKIEEPAEKKKEVKDSAKDKKQKKEKDEKKEDNKKKLAQKEKKPTKEK
jgi:small subunit ribosomal protein S1